MPQTDKLPAKSRIFEAAVSLFARKGYAAVGCREIASAAGVNISMICYYYGKKVDILKTIIDEGYEEYYHAVFDSVDAALPLEKRVRLLIQNLVEFFRENNELAMVAFNTLPIDIPEIVNLKTKWLSAMRETTMKAFTQLGLDTDDLVQMSVARGLLTSVISSHFQGKYVWDQITQAPGQSEHTKEYVKREPRVKNDDAFYEQYSKKLADFYLHGLSSIAASGAAGAETEAVGRRKKRRAR